VPGLEKVPDLVHEAVEALAEAHRPADIEDLLCGYLGHLLERNREINLVSRRNTLEHVRRFTRECLFLANILWEERLDATGGAPPAILDIGSGGGFPGMILKIAIPDARIRMMEATRKKARFLADVAAGLDLRETSIIWGRAEQIAAAASTPEGKQLEERFDWVTGKALGHLRDSTALAEPFLQPGGVHWTFKGARCRSELDEAGGIFRRRGFAPHRVERIPGDVESWVVGVRRLVR
jgi:16S rRNA (guanine527-N7)-methyltransferase